MEDTIFAPICPLGGSIVAIRFSGKSAFDILDLFGVKYRAEGINRELVAAKLTYKNEVVDEAVVKIFHEPNSFTGENVVELDLHASRLILDKVLKIAAELPNFRFAKNGEFSRRAFLNGKMDILKSEGINAIIRAETKQQQQLANTLFSGKLSEEYAKIRERLIHAQALVETNIDFSEEEVPQNVIDDVARMAEELKAKITACLADKTAIDKINNGVKVAIIGAPNVGKSSLINWLARREIAIVSPIAGTTRDVLSVDVDVEGYKVSFFDTAGMRETADLVEQEGVKRAKNIAECADAQIVIFDAENFQQAEFEALKRQYPAALFVLNKIDLRGQKNTAFDVNVSILKEENLDVLMAKIKELVLQKVELAHAPMLTNERHEALLRQCLRALQQIDFAALPIELISEELRAATDAVGQITGQVYTDDILDNIFSKFCIGK